MTPKLKIYDEEGKREIELIYDKVSFGRDAKCTVQIRDSMASREHCRIERAGTDYKLVDLGSRNGTKVNGAGVTGERVLAHGDEVQIGDVVIRFELPGGSPLAARPATARPSSPTNPARAVTSSKIDKSTRRVPRMRRSGQDAAMVGGILGAVVIVVLLAVVLSGGVFSGGGYAEASDLLNRAEQDVSLGNYEQAEALLARCRPSDPGLAARKATLLTKIEEGKRSFKAVNQDKVSEFEWARVDELAKKGDLKGPRLAAEYRRILESFPGTPASARAEVALAALKTAPPDPVDPEGSGSDEDPPEDPPPTPPGSGSDEDPDADPQPRNVDEAVAHLVKRQEFEAAINRLRDEFAKTANLKLNKRIEEVAKLGDQAYADVAQQAEVAAKAGHKDRARVLYEKVTRTFGHPWSDKADAALEKLSEE